MHPRLGAHSIEHATYMDDECIELFLAELWYVPTLAISHLPPIGRQHGISAGSSTQLPITSLCWAWRRRGCRCSLVEWFKSLGTRVSKMAADLVSGRSGRGAPGAGAPRVKEGATGLGRRWSPPPRKNAPAANLRARPPISGTVEVWQLADLLASANPLEISTTFRALFSFHEGRIVSDKRGK